MAPDELDRRVRDNLARVRERIERACDAAGRSADEVKLVGVSKYVGVEETAALIRAGCYALGESRPQQLWSKIEALEDGPYPQQWHLIGHLQRNKVLKTCECDVAVYLHAIDSLRLLTALDTAVAGRSWWSPALLEVNVSGDQEKHGFQTNEIPKVLEELHKFPNVRIKGLMTMAARGGDADTARRNFAALRDLRDRVATPELPLSELSMGMSGDFEQAIQEGSTLIRVGSALWEGIK